MKAGGSAAWIAAATTAITASATGRTGTMATGAAPSVSRPGLDAPTPQELQKAAGFRRLFRYLAPVPRAGKTPPVCWTSLNRFAKRRPLAKAFRAGSGRIAQLVEQMTLNHRVPGSSPGAPTKLFKDLR